MEHKIPPMKINLGQYGEHTLDFAKSFNSNDIEKALREQPANYDWFNSIYCRLKARSESKHDYLKETIAKRRSEIADVENEKRDKNVSQKELDSLVEKDSEVLTVKEEINDLNYQVNRLSGHLVALSQFHSIIKELSKRERSTLFNSLEEKEETPKEKAEKRVTGRKSRE